LSTLGTFAITAPRAEATPRILLVLAKLDARGASSENGIPRPELREVQQLDTCPNRATFCSAN
ncbi:MAG: hypothetical protein AAF974_12790, partial [Cyanobacteria bacterium P01_E01_bin.34]